MMNDDAVCVVFITFCYNESFATEVGRCTLDDASADNAILGYLNRKHWSIYRRSHFLPSRSTFRGSVLRGSGCGSGSGCGPAGSGSAWQSDVSIPTGHRIGSSHSSSFAHIQESGPAGSGSGCSTEQSAVSCLPHRTSARRMHHRVRKGTSSGRSVLHPHRGSRQTFLAPGKDQDQRNCDYPREPVQRHAAIGPAASRGRSAYTIS